MITKNEAVTMTHEAKERQLREQAEKEKAAADRSLSELLARADAAIRKRASEGSKHCNFYLCESKPDERLCVGQVVRAIKDSGFSAEYAPHGIPQIFIQWG